MLKLYESFNSDQAAVLVQVRSNHTYLKSYLAKIRAEEHARCGYKQDNKIVKHVLLRCSRYIEAWIELRVEVGDRYGDVSSLLKRHSKG